MFTLQRHKIYQLKSYFILCLLLSRTIPTEGAVESIDFTPSDTSGINLGELSVLQFVLFMLGALQLSVLYAVGALPFEFDLGAVVDKITGDYIEEDDESDEDSDDFQDEMNSIADYEDYYDVPQPILRRRKLWKKKRRRKLRRGRSVSIHLYYKTIKY